MARLTRAYMVCDVCGKEKETRRFQVRYPEGFLSYDLCADDQAPLYLLSERAGTKPGHRGARRRVVQEAEVVRAKKRRTTKRTTKRTAAAAAS